MSTQLINVVSFTLNAAASASLPHGLNVNGRALIPDIVFQDNSDFSIDAVDDTDVTVTNNGAGQATCNVWCEFKHTTHRWFGDAQTEALVPQPFVPAAGGGGGPAATSAVIFDDAVAADEVNIRSDRASNQSPIDNTRVGITNLGNATGAVASTGVTANYGTISGGDDNSVSAILGAIGGGSRNVVTEENGFIAGGFRNTVDGFAAHAEGQDNVVNGNHGHAEGLTNTVHADADNGAHAEGRNNLVSGDSAHVEGLANVASGDASHAEGNDTEASGGNSHAEGASTTASGTNSHAEGEATTASNSRSHAEGIQTLASGVNSHAEGNQSVASGANSHAEGGNCTASGDYSHAEGYQAVASRSGQSAHASGRVAVDGDAQTSQIVGRIIPQAAPVTIAFSFGDAPLAFILLQNDRAYAIRVHAVAGGGAAGAVSASIVRDMIVRASGGVATVIAQSAQEIIGHATAVANWTISADVPSGNLELRFQFSTGADAATTNISVTARVEFVECAIT